MPVSLARPVVHRLDRTTAAADAVGWVFTTGSHWGFFLPDGSDDPVWPSGTTYLKPETCLLSPVERQLPQRDGEYQWVRRTGPPISRPLPLHVVVSLIAR